MPDFTKTLMVAYWWTLFKGGLSNCRITTFAFGPAIHTRFDDLYLTSGLQLGQNHKLQVVCKFLSIVV